MSVRPIAFAPNGDATLWHDEAGHGGAVALVDLRFGRRDDGTPNPDVVELSCPVCGVLVAHPIGGGADAGGVQKLFLRLLVRRAAALGIPVAQRTLPALLARLRARIEAADGAGRFRLGRMTSEDDTPDA